MGIAFRKNLVLATAGAIAIALAGCATKSNPRAVATAGSRVVVINTLDTAVMNAHIGATVFGNYNEPISNDWNIPAAVDAYVAALFRAEGSEVVNVVPDPDKLERLRDRAHLSMGWSEFHLVPAYAAWFQDLADRNQASAVVVLLGIDLQIVPNSVARYGGYGIVSYMGFKPDRAFLFSLAMADVLAGKPLVLTSGAGPGNCRKAVSTDSIQVSNLRDMTSGDLEQFRRDLGGLVEKSIGHSISASGLIRAEVPPCEFQN